MKLRSRKIWSYKHELITKAREAMLSAVAIFNSPSITFKTESFVVLSNIAWTYLLHAYYRKVNIDYKYYVSTNKRKKYDRTKNGAYKYWELERCLNDDRCPIDRPTCTNLRFLIGLRHEIEHQMTTRIDDFLSARCQACCLNFNFFVKKLFGNEFGIDKHLSFSLQFSSISEAHVKQLNTFEELPKNIGAYMTEFDKALGDEEFNSPKFAYRVFYVPKSVNHKGQADRVIEFIPSNSPEAEGLNKEYVVIRDREKPKLLAGDIVKKMKQQGFVKFNQHVHTQVWKLYGGKNPKNGYGVLIATSWYWYETWLSVVEQYCSDHKFELT